MQRPEENLQIACVAYLRASLPRPWICNHIPNGGYRTKVEAGKFKAMGVLPGMPDLLVWGPHPSVYGTARDEPMKAIPIPFVVAIEFKAPPKRLKAGGKSVARPRLSPAQTARQADLGACGVPYLVIDDMAEMVQALKALGVPLRGRAM